MPVDAADVSSKSGKAGAVHQISSTPWEGEKHLKLTSAWDKTLPESDKVEHTKVTFHNRYGITLAADLYMPKNRQGRMPALAVAGRPIWRSERAGCGNLRAETGRNGIYYHGF